MPPGRKKERSLPNGNAKPSPRRPKKPAKKRKLPRGSAAEKTRRLEWINIEDNGCCGELICSWPGRARPRSQSESFGGSLPAGGQEKGKTRCQALDAAEGYLDGCSKAAKQAPNQLAKCVVKGW